jgi:hypothetical protein
MNAIEVTQESWGISSQSPTIIKKYDSLGETNVIVGSASSYPSSAFFPTDEEAVAHAHLMSAAPDLYAALKEIIDTPWIGGKGGLVRARAALAKARGEA